MTKHADNLLETQAKDFLRQTLTAAVQIDSKELELLMDLFELVSYKKNHVIIEEGKVADFFYFIYKGAIRIYFYKKDKPVIERFEKKVVYLEEISHTLLKDLEPMSMNLWKKLPC